MFAGQVTICRKTHQSAERDVAAFCGLMKRNCSFWVKGPPFVRWPSNAELKPQQAVKDLEPGLMISHTVVLSRFLVNQDQFE